MIETIHIVQAFERGPRVGLTPRHAQQFKTANGAFRRAELAFSGDTAGVVAYGMSIDEDAGDYGEPTILAGFGEVPEFG